MTALMEPAFEAGVTVTRLDERVARSPVGAGFLERSQFTDACASLWIDGELVHLEDLVLHDATKDIRTPTHGRTIARDVLRTRRRISGQSPGWALSADGIRSLRKTAEIMTADMEKAQTIGAIRRAVTHPFKANEAHTGSNCAYIPLTYPTPKNILWDMLSVNAEGVFDGTRCGISEQS